MLNILSYVGMSLQSEVCLWTLLGLVRTIFDATLFKVNANLKQVWQMSMPEELSRPVQRALRTMISGIMLVQCFTVYVYLASYIVLLYPVFLEERPTLVLPWLLLAAIRKLLCELTSLALGLGTCVLLGPARPSCIKFVVIKVISIMPSFYMWMLLYSYYHVLKVASVYKSFPVALPSSDHDYGLELAVRRRKTKSLLREDQLRTKLIENLYNESPHSANTEIILHKKDYSTRMTHGTDTSTEDFTNDDNINILQPLSTTSNRIISDTGCYEDWFGSEVMVPRDTDRILEQFGLMMLRIGAYLTKEGPKMDAPNSHIFNSGSTSELRKDNLDAAPMPPVDTDTPPLVGSSKGKTASYLRDYPQIFMKKPSEIPLHSDITLSLTSDDRLSSQKHKYQPQSEENNPNTLTNKLKLSDEDLSVGKDNQIHSQRLDFKETTQNKLQIMSSEKSVSFEPNTFKSTLQDVHSNDYDIESSEKGQDKCLNLEERDSLQSIIENMKALESCKDKSFHKDVNKEETQETSSSHTQTESGARKVNPKNDARKSSQTSKSSKNHHKKTQNR